MIGTYKLCPIHKTLLQLKPHHQPTYR